MHYQYVSKLPGCSWHQEDLVSSQAPQLAGNSHFSFTHTSSPLGNTQVVSSVHSPTLQLAGHLHSSFPYTSAPTVNPHIAVSPGQPLPQQPALPDTLANYFLTKLKGSISRHNGCGNNFLRDLPRNTLDSEILTGGKERDGNPKWIEVLAHGTWAECKHCVYQVSKS